MQIKRKNIKGLDNKGISLKYRKQKRPTQKRFWSVSFFIIDKDVHITFYRSRKSPGRDGLRSARLLPLIFVRHVFLGYAIPK